MKFISWYSAYLIFNAADILMYAMTLNQCIRFIVNMPKNAWYFIQVTDLRKRDRFLRHQSKRFGLVLITGLGSLFLCITYTIMMTGTFIDSVFTVSESTSWIVFVTFIVANVGHLAIIYGIYEIVALFIQEERGEYEDGLRATFEDMKEVMNGK